MSVKVRKYDSPYHISKDCKLELEHFCMQYDEWNLELSKISFYQKPNGERVDTSPSDPVANIVERREFLLNKIHLIKRCLNEACDEAIADYIFESVTRKKSYDALRAYAYIPCSRKVFYDERAKFFYYLSKYR